MRLLLINKSFVIFNLFTLIFSTLSKSTLLLKETVPSNLEWFKTFKKLVVKLLCIVALLLIIISLVLNSFTTDKLLLNLYEGSVKSPPFIWVALSAPTPDERI